MDRCHSQLISISVCHCIPVDVQHKANVFVLVKIPLDGLSGTVVGNAVGRIIVKCPIVDHRDPSCGQKCRQSIPHRQHIVRFLRCAVRIAFCVLTGVFIAFRCVGMDDQHARLIPCQIPIKRRF